MKRILLFLLMTGSVSLWGQVTENYQTQTGNFNATHTINLSPGYTAGTFNNGGSEIGLFANGTGGGFIGNPGVATFRTFTESGTNSGATARPLQLGDQFTITGFVSNSSSFFVGGTAGVSFNASTNNAQFSDYETNSRIQLQINQNGNWFIDGTSGTANGFSTPGSDVTITFKLTTPNRASVTLTGTSGATTHDVVLGSTGSIESFVIWNQTSGNSNDMFWKNASLTATGSLELGGSNSSFTVSDVLEDGRDANSASTSRTNNLIKNGSGTVTLSGVNTYSGTTTINDGTLVLGASGVIPDASAIVLDGGTLSTGATAGFSETADDLTLSSNSTISLGTGSHSLAFAASNGNTWSGTLTISGWSGTAGPSGSGTAGRIFFGSDASSLTSAQLAEVEFSGYAKGAALTSSGELVPAYEQLPTTDASGLSFADVGRTRMTLNWNSGNGSNRIVVVRPSSAVDFTPASGTNYTANSDFSAGSGLGSSNDNKVVYNGNGNSVVVTGLTAGTSYHIAVYEYNGSSGGQAYKTDAPLTGSRQAETAYATVSSGSVNWNQAGSWIDGVVPSNGDAHIIRTTTVLNTNATSSGITIDGGSLTVSSGNTLILTGQASGGSNGDIVVEGTLEINTGASMTFSPEYATNSNLVYDGLTNYGANNEWATNTTAGTDGAPFNVTLTGNSTVDFGNATAFRQCNGDFTIADGSSLTLSTAIGGDLRIGGSGNWINQNTTVGSGFTSNNRAIRFVGGVDQTMSNSSGTTTVGYLLNEKTGGNLILNNNLVLNGTGTGTVNVLQLLSSSSLDLNNFDITINGDQARAIEADGGARSITGTGEVVFQSGSAVAAVVGDNGGTLSFGSNVTVELNKGVNFGSGVTTFEGTLAINNNGFCDTHAPEYGTSSTLEYRTGAFINGNEWTGNTTTTGTGQPNNITLNLDNATDIFQTSGDRTVAENLTITSGVLQVNAGQTLTVDNGISVANGSKMVLKSSHSGATSTSTASLIQNSTSVLSINGTIEVEQNTGDVADHNRYQYWSSPITSATMGGVFTGSNSSDFYTWDESQSGGNVAGGQWSTVLSGATMTPGRGYATTPSSGNTTTFNETRTFSGTVNNGTVNVSLNSPAADDFVFVGNPYPSAITSATFVSDNSNITGSLYFWNQATPPTGFNGSGNNNTGDYATWNGVGSASGGNGGVSPDDYVQSCQGFFVQLTGTPGTQITFNNAQRTSGNNSQFFKTTTETRERFWVNLYNDQGAFNQILVGLLDDATFGYDRIYDAYKFKGSSDLAFYSVDHGNDYAIQGLPKLDLNNNMHTVALGVDAWQTGRYTIALDSLNNWPSARAIILTDSALGQTVDLMQQDYDFVVNQTGEVRNRFYISYSDQTVNLPKLTKDEQFFAFQRGQELILDGSELSSAFTQVELYNLSGQLVKSTVNADQQAELTMNVGDLSQGVYILKVKSGKQTFNQKISIK